MGVRGDSFNGFTDKTSKMPENQGKWFLGFGRIIPGRDKRKKETRSEFTEPGFTPLGIRTEAQRFSRSVIDESHSTLW